MDGLSFKSEFQEILNKGNFTLIGKKLKNNQEVKVDVTQNNQKWNVSISPSNHDDILWNAGLLEPENKDTIIKQICTYIRQYQSLSRSVIVAIDTNILLSNQINFVMSAVNSAIRQEFVYEKEALLVTTQGMEYEFHHQSGDVKKSSKTYPKKVQNSFKLPSNNLSGRGRRGVFGRFMHQVAMARYGHLMVQTQIPILVNNFYKSENNNSLSPEINDPKPSSSYFDIVILEQIQRFASVTNAVVIFFTADSDMSKIGGQSGIKSFYIKRKNKSKVGNLAARKIFWVFITMLIKNDIVTVKQNGEEVQYIMCKNNNGSGVNLYFRKENMNKFYVIHPKEKIF